MSRVRITTGGKLATTATVELDGHDVAPFTRNLTLIAGAGEVTQLRLEIIASEAAEFDGEAVVRVDAEFAKLLVGLGWTPPAEMEA